MTVYVVDANAAIELARRRFAGAEGVELFAPTLLRSQIMSILCGELSAKEDPDEMLALAERACRLPRRLLGDAVLRQTAWKLATEHGWSDTYDAEYIALTLLHGEGLVSASPHLRERAAKLVKVLDVDRLLDTR